MSEQPDQSREARLGVIYGLAAYGWWGLVPIYFKAVASVAALEVLAHRVIWSVLLLSGLMTLRRGWTPVIAALRHRATAITLVGTTLFIATNWYLFIWAVAHEQVLQASLGYYINPLIYVLLGAVFLKERLRRWQRVSVGLAAVAVLYLTISYGRVPWIALTMATSFGFYGLLRKTVRIGSLAGLTVETALLLPAALGYAMVQGTRGVATFASGSIRMDLLLVLAGVVTAVPLLWFTSAARRLRLATLGFLQYVAPTGHFLLAVLAYSEPFTSSQAITFGLIWTALAVYSVDTVRAQRHVA